MQYCSSLVVRHAVNIQTNNMQCKVTNRSNSTADQSLAAGSNSRRLNLEIVAEEAAANCGKSSKQ